MVSPFDIFRLETSGRVVWQSTAQTLELAHRKIELLIVSQPGEYLIYSQATGRKTVVRAKNSAEISPRSPIDTP